MTTTMGRGRYEAEASRPLELRDYLDVMRRRFSLIAVIAILFAALAFLYANNQSNQYESTASVLIQPIQVDRAETNLRVDQLINIARHEANTAVAQSYIAATSVQATRCKPASTNGAR